MIFNNYLYIYVSKCVKKFNCFVKKLKKKYRKDLSIQNHKRLACGSLGSPNSST